MHRRSTVGVLGLFLVMLSADAPRQATAEDVPPAAQASAVPMQATQLEVLAAPELIRCTPVSLNPCFSMNVVPTDAAGVATAVLLPPKQQLLQSVHITANGETLSPFYVSPEVDHAAERPNIVLIGVDVSGSMNEPDSDGSSRFSAAKQAIANYLGSMQDDVDEVAIVPFESHHVVPTIQAAVFTSKRAEAITQLNALPQPSSKSNTALFQAVYSGVQTLRAHLASLARAGTQTADLHPSLIVMTDGKNEVARSDDQNLLDGPLGLEQAAAQVASSGVDVIGIGFGNPRLIDQDALRRLSKHTFLAGNGDELTRVLHATTPQHAHTLTISFLSPWGDRSSLASHDVDVWAALSLPDGRKLISQPTHFLAPALSAPLFQRQASVAELEALLLAKSPASAGWNFVLRDLLIALGLTLLLILLWFWVPRLIWREEWEPAWSVPASSRRWQPESYAGSPLASFGPGFPLPEGFGKAPEPDKHQRSAEQLTQLYPTGTDKVRPFHANSNKSSR